MRIPNRTNHRPCAVPPLRPLLVAGFLLAGCSAALAFNSEEHKLLVDLGVSQVVPPAGVTLPWPSRFEAITQTGARAAYTAAKQLAVGYSSNNTTWHSNCASIWGPDTYPAAYNDQALGVQDNSYWDALHSSFNQIEGNLNMWVPPSGYLQVTNLYVSGYMDANVRVFTMGDLASIYGDYRRTCYASGGNCYLSNAALTTIGFNLGNDCYGVWPFQNCGFRPDPIRADSYLKRIAAGLWPPYGCLGNAVANTAGDSQWNDAGWWGDEMMRIANANDWHFSRAAVAWYIGMHRLALLYVDLARTDPTYWNQALHYEANGLHSLTDLFCFGHIVTNRDETSYGIIEDRGLTGDTSYLWMENVLAMGGAARTANGRINLTGVVPTLADRSTDRNDFLPTYQGVWANWSRWEHDYHGQFNASGAVVRNLRGDTFSIYGDGAVRGMLSTDRAVISSAVQASVLALFDAYQRLQDGEPVASIAAEGSSYFEALKWIPVFVESDPGNHFRGRWTRYAGHAASVAGSGAVPAGWASCQMAYINGGENLPTPSATPCTSFPDHLSAAPEVAAAPSLAQNFPNPFNPSTSIAFTLTEAAAVDLSIYDTSGRLVRTLAAGRIFAPGAHAVSWNGRDDRGRAAAAGVYLYRLDAGTFSETRRMALLK